MIFHSSPVESIFFENQQFYLKRDDLLHPDFSGNKARKFHYFLQNDFPNITKVVSYGSAQSNAMYSLSVLAKMKGWEFEYTVDHVADYLKDNPHGNYKAAIDNGMQLIAGRDALTLTNDVLFSKEGIVLVDSRGQKYICGEVSNKEKPLTLKLLKKVRLNQF